ncbi:MAG: transporter, partial [Elusimicrobia bacterium]|nr:transporter [Elusimicrobiota bacterium]
MLRLQPVIPLPFDKEYAVVSRTVLPFISQDKVVGRSSQTGLGDTEQSFFFTPMKPAPDGIKWGVGPVFYLPTATNPDLGLEKWGLGPTGVILTQQGPWTAGLLGNHIWSVAGHKDRQEISQTYLKPFGAYTFS